MKQQPAKTCEPLHALRMAAVKWPEAEDGIACEGTALKKRTVKVRNKAFLFLGVANAMLKLRESLPKATERAANKPSRYKVGATGWVTINFGGVGSLPLDVLARWVGESYRLFAPPKQEIQKAKESRLTAPHSKRHPTTRRPIMTATEIVKDLKALGTDGYKRVLLNHGIKEPFFGVKIEEMKKIQKRVKKDYQLALDLFDTGIYDAMYLAGLIADDMKMTKKDLHRWVEDANCNAISTYTVAWVAAESNHGHELALEWIESEKESVAISGWATLSSLVAIKDDADLDLPELKKLLQRVQKTIHDQPNSVRYVMNGFVIAVGSYVKGLTTLALEVGTKIGKLTVELAGDCKLPYSPEYIQKVQKRRTVGKKRKSAKC